MLKSKSFIIYQRIPHGFSLGSFILVVLILLLFTPFVLRAETIQINLQVGVDTPPPPPPPTTTPPGGGGPSPVPGCTDPLASNYNPGATVDNGSCVYLPVTIPNVSNFQASFNNQTEVVSLSWLNPSFAQFSGVRIVRLINSIPTNPNEGVIIYDSIGQSAIDTNLVVPGTYFYVAFVRDTNGQYSSGAIASAVVTTATPPTPVLGCMDPGASNYNPNATVSDGSCIYPDPTDPDPDPGPADPTEPPIPGGPTLPPGTLPPLTDPFLSFPQALLVHPQIANLTLADFRFLQIGRPIQFFSRGSVIYIDGRDNFTVYLPYNRVPEVLKTIGVTLTDPQGNSFSFLLRANEDKTAYEATIGPLSVEGRYGVNIYILNFEDQTMKKITGSLEVVGAFDPLAFLDNAVTNLLSSIAVGSGLVAGVVQLAVLTTGYSSLLDLYLLFLRFLGYLSGLFGLRRRHKPWGTVYDAITKRPIDPAYVSVYLAGTEKEETSAITDIDGRYGFFLPAGKYKLTAGKTNYNFPSKKMAGRTSDEIYGNLYFGEEFETRGEEVVNRNIPLDPVGFDWNEFAKNKAEFFKVYSKKEITRARIFNTIYTLGFVFAGVSMFVTPSLFNLVVLLLYVTLSTVGALYRHRHKVVAVHWIENGEPIPFAVIRFFLADVDQEVKHIVTDHLGRFFVLLRPGRYYFTVEEKQPDESYIKVYQSSPLELKKGVLTKDITIERKIETEPSSLN